MKGKKVFQIGVLAVGALYLAAVVWATVYSQTGYVESLPLVELGTAEEGVVPASAAAPGPEGPVLYSVSQEDGPWGKRYLLRQVPSYILWAREDGSIFIYDIASVEDPLVFSASVPLETLYDGMEVRLR